MRQFIPLVLVLLLCLLCGQVSSYLVVTDRAEWTFTVSQRRYISITDAYAEKTDTGWLVIVEYALTEEPGMDSISITLPTFAPSSTPTSASSTAPSPTPSSTPTSAPSPAPSPAHIISSEEISDEVETTEEEKTEVETTKVETTEVETTEKETTEVETTEVETTEEETLAERNTP